MDIKERWPQSYLSYFSTGFHWRIFLLSRANRLYSIFFYTGLKNLGSLVSQIFFCLQPGILAMVRLPATNPAKQLTSLLVFFADGEKGATSVLGPQPIIWLLPSSSPPWSGDFVRATRYNPSQVTVNSNSSHPTSIVSVGYHVTILIRRLQDMDFKYFDRNHINFWQRSGLGDCRCVMVIVLGNGHSEPSSNPRQGCLHFTDR